MLRACSSRLSFFNDWLRILIESRQTPIGIKAYCMANNSAILNAPGNFVAPKNYQCHAMSN